MRPHKSVNTQLVPHEGRSSVDPDRLTSARVASCSDSSLVCGCQTQHPNKMTDEPYPMQLGLGSWRMEHLDSLHRVQEVASYTVHAEHKAQKAVKGGGRSSKGRERLRKVKQRQ